MNATKSDARAPLHPLHKGPHLNDRPTALWVVPWISVLEEETGLTRRYVMVRDPVITREGRDNASFVHVPARRVFPQEVMEDRRNRSLIKLDRAVDQIIHYYSGLRLSPHTDIKVLHHEETALFSGPQENMQAVCVMTCLGENLHAVPKILTIANGGSYPDALNRSIADIDLCNTYRTYVDFVDFELLMDRVTQKGSVNDLIYSPSHSPFWVKGLEILDGARFWHTHHKGMQIQGTVLSILEKAADELGVPRGKPPEGRQRWVTRDHICQALYALDDGKYRNDKRLKGWTPPAP